MAPVTTERMDLRKLQRIVIDALEDIKGQDIRVYDTTSVTDLFDRVVMVSGTSNRQTRSMASHVRDKVKQAGGHVISVEGEETGEWVLVDLGDVVVHVMQPAIRAYYNLEELWGSKPVRVKLGAPAGSSHAKASEPEPDDDDLPAAAPAKRAPSRKPKAPLAAAAAPDASGAPERKPRAASDRKPRAASAKSASAKPASAKPASARPASAKPASAKTGSAKAGSAKPSAAKPGEPAGKPRAPRTAKAPASPRAG